MLHKYALFSVSYLLLPPLAFAEELYIHLTADVTYVDSEAQRDFAVGDTFEMVIPIDTEKSRVYSSTDSSGTREGMLVYTPDDVTYQDVRLRIGPEFVVYSTLDPIILFLDDASYLPPSQQGFLIGGSFDSPRQRLGGQAHSFSIYFSLLDTPFSARDSLDALMSWAEIKSASYGPTSTVRADVIFDSGRNDLRLAVTHFAVSDTPVSLPVANHYIDQIGIADSDGNGTAELASLYIEDGYRTRVKLRDALSDAAVKTIGFFSENFIPYNLSTLPDLNGNGSPEIAVFGAYPFDYKVRTLIRDSRTAETINTIYQTR